MRRPFALSCALVLAFALGGGDALAEAPADALRAAVAKAAQARTARVALTQRAESAGRVVETKSTAALAGGDSDVVATGEGGQTRRVAIGTAVYERRPEPAGTWKKSTRPAPIATSALGPLTLADGTSIGDPKLFRSVTATAGGASVAATATTRVLTAELDMAAVAAAMRLGATDAARLQQLQGTLTVSLDASGNVTRQVLRLVVPGANGPTILETAADLTDLDTPLQITAP